MTHSTTYIADKAEIKSVRNSGYGHYLVTITIYGESFNYDSERDEEVYVSGVYDYSFVTTSVDLIDKLRDREEEQERREAIETLIDYGMIMMWSEKSDEFEYIY